VRHFGPGLLVHPSGIAGALVRAAPENPRRDSRNLGLLGVVVVPRTKERAEAALTEEDRGKLTDLYKTIFNAMRCVSGPAGVSRVAPITPAPDPIRDEPD
jgi:hypothetical protein